MKTAKNTRPDEEILDGLLQLERRRVFFSFDTGGVPPATVSAEDRVWREHNTELHPFREILVILDGDMQFQLAGQVYAGRSGDMALIDSFEAHDRFHPPSVRDALTLWLVCSPRTISCLVNRTREGKNKLLMHFEFARSEFCAMLNSVWRDALNDRKSPSVAKLEICGVVDVVMGAFAEKIMTSGYEEVRRLGEVQNRQYLTVMSAMAYVSGHPNENPQLGELAKKAGYSTVHFARLFRQYAGCGFREYVDVVRMELYRKMYSVKHMHKKEIAVELGFSSSSSLIHWLRTADARKAERLEAARSGGDREG